MRQRRKLVLLLALMVVVLGVGGPAFGEKRSSETVVEVAKIPKKEQPRFEVSVPMSPKQFQAMLRESSGGRLGYTPTIAHDEVEAEARADEARQLEVIFCTDRPRDPSDYDSHERFVTDDLDAIDEPAVQEVSSDEARRLIHAYQGSAVRKLDFEIETQERVEFADRYWYYTEDPEVSVVVKGPIVSNGEKIGMRRDVCLQTGFQIDHGGKRQYRRYTDPRMICVNGKASAKSFRVAV